MASAWPKEVLIPKEIGRFAETNDDGSPCCALGHMRQYDMSHHARVRWHAAYKKAAQADGKHYECVVSINDSSPARKRRLYYLAAWAILGYTEGMPEEVLKLAEKATKEGRNHAR